MMNPTKESFAAMLNGREYGEEITKEEESQAKDAGLVVVFGYSDDNVELRGAIYDEISSYDGTTVLLKGGKAFRGDGHDCDCEFCGYKALTESAVEIEAIWDKEGYSWIYQTQIPHATFDILEDGGDKFCRGIVFSIKDVPQ